MLSSFGSKIFQRWSQILSLTWLLCAISKEKRNLWVAGDHLVFEGYNLKWRNTRSMFYNVIVLDHIIYKTTIYVLYKIYTWCFRKQLLTLVWNKYRPHTGQIRYKCFMVSSFIFAKIESHALLVKFWHVCWYFLWQWWLQCFLLACSAQRNCCWLLYLPINDFATAILKSSKEIELPSFVYVMWLFTMAMMIKNILK